MTAELLTQDARIAVAGLSSRNHWVIASTAVRAGYFPEGRVAMPITAPQQRPEIRPFASSRAGPSGSVEHLGAVAHSGRSVVTPAARLAAQELHTIRPLHILPGPRYVPIRCSRSAGNRAQSADEVSSAASTAACDHAHGEHHSPASHTGKVSPVAAKAQAIGAAQRSGAVVSAASMTHRRSARLCDVNCTSADAGTWQIDERLNTTKQWALKLDKL